jgi:hypothetical protein
VRSGLREYEHYVAVDNSCAWPNLTVLPDGSVGATIFNRPSHGRVEGDVELWVSPDGRAPWSKRSAVSEHAPRTVRMNVAAGTGRDGVLVALVGGWLLDRPHAVRTRNLMRPVVCRSQDAGHTWERTDTFEPPDGAGDFVPFGNLRVGQDGALYVPAYDCRMSGPAPETRLSSSYLFRSEDNGRHWRDARLIGRDRFTETDVVQTREGHWLAAARTLADYAHPDLPGSAPSVALFRADGRARDWVEVQPLTVPAQHPGNLLALQDGRILLTCGSRVAGYAGVFTKVSEDGGRTWEFLASLVTEVTLGDCGYPSSVQLADGTSVTAYYASTAPHHHNYHMAVIRWRL